MLTSNIKDHDWVSVRQATAKSSTKLGPTANPTFAGLTLTDLTASRLISTDASKGLVSTDLASWVTGTANEINIADDGDGTITIGIVDPLIASKGGTGLATITNHGLMLGSGTGAVTVLAEGTDGQLPIGSTGNDPVLATLTGTANRVTVANAAGSITLSAPQDLHTGASPEFAGGTFTGVVTGVTPTSGTHLATKEYVDLALGARKDFFLSNTVAGAYLTSYPRETGEASSTVVTPALAEGDNQLVQGFITEAGEPGTTTIRQGIIPFHFHAKKGASNHRITELYGVISRVDADGTSNKTTVATTEVSTGLTEVELSYEVHAVLGADVEVASTSRLILDVYANVGAGALASVVTLYMEGADDSYFSTNVDSGVWQSHGDVLDDLNTVGPVTGDSYMLVGTGAGVFAWETGATLRTSIGVDAAGTGAAAVAAHELTYDHASYDTAVGWGDHAGLYSLTAHLHNLQTLECDGIDSDGGAFSFSTTGTVTFNRNVSLGTGEVTCGSINKAANTLTLEIAGTPVISILGTHVNIAQTVYALGGNIVVGVEDTTAGVITCHGAASGTYGARLFLYPNADAAGTLNYYYMYVEADDLHIGDNVNGDRVSIIGDAGLVTLAAGAVLSSDAAPTTDAMIANKKYVDDSVVAPAAHTHDGDTLQLNGVNSDGGAFAFNTTGVVTFNYGIAVPAGKTISLSGHLVLPVSNSIIGCSDGTPQITFDDTDNQIEVTGNIVGSNSLFLAEKADQATNIANHGQIWAKTGAPNTLWFSDDAGTDFQLGLDVRQLTEITTIDAAADFIPVLDDTDSVHKKIKPTNLGHRFVDRGDPATVDYSETDLTMLTSTYYDLDLSAIVPVGAKAVLLAVVLQDDLVGSRIKFRKNGNSNTRSVSQCYSVVANAYTALDCIVPCDTGRVIEYDCTTSCDFIAITVKGWWV